MASWILRETRALLGQEQVLGELLGQRRAAFHAAVAGRVADEGAQNADRIDAPMIVEAAVLDGDEGFRQIRRQFGEMDGRAAHVAAIGEQGAIIIENGDVGRPLGNGELIDRRQLRRVISDDRGRSDGAPEPEHQHPVDEPAQERRPLLAL